MELAPETLHLIQEAKNVCIIPSQTNEPESLTAALALFYTLKELGKNVNLIIEKFPEKLNFLIPSIDYISSPKNFVISVPRAMADVSQIYYEKNDDSLKIHLTIDKGHIKKDDISFYFSEAKPNLVITLGIQDLQSQLASQLNSFGFLLDTPIINIDADATNKKFGQVNIIQQTSLAEIVAGMAATLSVNGIKKETANCLLAGLVLHYENFKNSFANADIFNLASHLIKQGAQHDVIIDNVYRATERELQFLGTILQNLKPQENGTSVAELESDSFYNFAETEATTAIEKIKTLGMPNDLLVLWKSHNSEPMIKGFFYSKKPHMINKFAEHKESTIKQGWVFLALPGQDIHSAKENIIKLL